MKKLRIAATLAVAAGFIGSTNIASAACSWGAWGSSTNVQGSFTSGYASCSSPNSWDGVFKARTWLGTPCTLGAGCEKLTAQRENSPYGVPIDQCTLPGIGVQARGNRFNISTGAIEIDTLAVNEQPSLTCNNPRTSTSTGNWFWTTAHCRIAWGC